MSDLYHLTITDSNDTMTFDILDAPIQIKDNTGAVDNVTIDGNVFTDYLYMKKQWEQKWAIMTKTEYNKLRGFFTRQWSNATTPTVSVTTDNTTIMPATKMRIDLSDGGVINACETRQNVKLLMRETV